ncbi:hypothetical protein WBJ53_14990 [Spirosoma sp. SC4-14]|uniref:hypothetical protein n=1 Tax=Spirosoma sp. SC4-14 TaxID=3128900 RepID=UPI0030D3C3CB
MTTEERFQVAITRVKGGESIPSVVAALYRNWRQFKKDCTDAQRKKIRAARLEYKATRKDLPTANKRYPRFIANTTPELHRAVSEYCETNGIDLSRFINSSLRTALNKSRSN